MQSKVDDKFVDQLAAVSREEGIQKLVVGAVIRKDGKFVLLERVASDFMGGLVELPSGNVDPGEGLLTALAREVHEETGLVVDSVLAYLGSFDYISGSGKKARQFNFFVGVEPGEVILAPAEHRSRHFVETTDESFAGLNISDATRAVLQVADSLQLP